MTSTGRPLRIARLLFSLLLLTIGLILVVGGGYLLSLGGSPYYLAAGLAVAASSVLTFIGDRRGFVVYAAMLIGTLAWSLWEAGLDGWALTARLVAPALLGVGFLFVAGRHEPTGKEAGKSKRISGAAWLAAVGVAMVVGLVAHAVDPKGYADPIYQTGSTDLTKAALTQPAAGSPPVAAGDWPHYGSDIAGSHYSTLDQLTPANVGKLKPAWELHLGPTPGTARANLEVTPIKIGSSLYICKANNDVLSVDAESGRVNWRFLSGVTMAGRPNGTCRGVAYYQVPGETGLCASRIITNTVDARLLALDATSGRPCPDFGVNGQTDLTTGMGKVDKGYYYVSSAPTIIRDKIVLGGWVSDGQYWGEPSGVIRAYDAATGRLAWAFDVGRPSSHGEPLPGQTYTPSTPNSWAPMSGDPALGLVYAGTGNATPDYYGAQRRPFDDLYSSAVLALDVETGALKWSFQTTHHDLWDYDVPSQPTLVDIPTPSGVQHALVQATKRGEIFLLDRGTGHPLATVEERPAPQTGKAPGERLSSTQPFSVGMPSFGGPRWVESDMWGVTPLDQMWCRIKFKEARYEGAMTPPGLTPNIVYPGYLGGVEWGGVSVDPSRSLLIVNSNRLGNFDRLMPRMDADKRRIAPSVNGSPRSVDGIVAQAKTPYAAQINPFLSPLATPCNKPPYGLISAVDLRTHKLVWSKPLGTARDSGPLGLRSMLPFVMGTPNLGGATTTAGGLIFIAATQEHSFRALDVITGRELWNVRLPAGGQASPMTYWSDASRRQFVVVAAGGHAGLRSKPGDSIVAYALPH